MSTKHHRITLEHLFAHPINLNIEWKKVEHLFEALGAELNETQNGRMKIKLKGQTASFAVPHYGGTIGSKDEVMALRHFLQEVEVTPESFGEE